MISTNKQKSKQRYLSPSYKKGAVKPKNKDDEFKLNLILNGKEEDIKNSPKKAQKTSKRLSIQNDVRPIPGSSPKMPSKKHKSVVEKEITEVTEKAKNISLEQKYIKKIGSISQAGKGEDGLTKVNQDSFFVIPNEFKFTNFNIFSVLDGHGLNGHLISGFATKYFQNKIHKHKKLSPLESEDDIYKVIKKNNYEIIRHLFTHCEKEISKSEIDANFSGTTCVMLLQIGTKLICANVGDSRCIMVTDKEIEPLSIDQKPNNQDEMDRIVKSGGEVSQFEEDGIKSGPFRVWKKNEMYPGIAMSRSIGDLIATTLGVIPEPIIIEKEITPGTKFIILASDGVWEFLDNKMVKELVMPFYLKNDPEGACKALIKESTKWWENEDVVVDDITVIAIFF